VTYRWILQLKLGYGKLTNLDTRWSQKRYDLDMTDSIFSKIIRGEIESHKVYEDDFVIAILDTGPLSEGHTLVIPKEPAETLDELSDEHAAAVGRVLPRITRAIKRVTGAGSINVLQNNGEDAGQVVPHVHFHLIPRYSDRGENVSGKPNKENGPGLRVQWTPGTLTQEEAHEIGKHIKRLL
jgi:histidine triad (HIT) family protein